MHWADIQAAIYKSGFTPAQIARQEGVSNMAVHNVIRGSRTSHEVAYAIAAVTGISCERMWPGRYLTPSAYRKARGNNTAGRLPKVAV